MKEELAAKTDPSLEDYKCVLSAYDYMRRKSAEKHGRTRACLEQVVAHSPDYSTAWALLSWIYGDEERYGYNRSIKGDGLERALRAAQQAIATNPTNPTAYQYLAIARFELGNDDAGARQAAEVALRLSPNNSEILANSSWIFAHLDGDAQSRELGLKAIRLNPGHPSWYWNGLTIHALRNGLKADALRYARLNNTDQTIWEVYLLAAAQRMNGDQTAADTTLEKLEQAHPEAIRDRERQMRVLRIPSEIKPLIWGNRPWD
jgi:tetratricopeptide (TPR) repeat protein